MKNIQHIDNLGFIGCLRKRSKRNVFGVGLRFPAVCISNNFTVPFTKIERIVVGILTPLK